METNHSEDVPKDFGTVSEDYQNPSESVPKDSEKPSEAFGTFPNKERTEHHTLTVRDVAHIFEENKLSVTERTITNWCKPNAKGVCRLDCVYEESDYRYYITPRSVEEVIKEESSRFRKFTEFFWKPSERNDDPSEDVPNRSETNGNPSENLPKDSEQKEAPSESLPKESGAVSEPAPPVSEEPKTSPEHTGAGENERDKLFQLEAQVMELRIETKAKDFFIDQLKSDRETFRKSFEDERRQFVDLISKQAVQIGEYKEKLLQIEAPKHEHVRDVAEERPQTSGHDMHQEEERS